MENKEKYTQTRLKLIFWVNLSIAVIALLAILLIVGPNFGTNIAPGVLFEQYSIIITLACIPLSLKLFHSQYQKIKDKEQDEFLRKYINAYILRMAILDAAIAINIAGLYIYESHNAVYMAIITIFALFFCFPNKKILENRKEDNNKNINNE